MKTSVLGRFLPSLIAVLAISLVFPMAAAEGLEETFGSWKTFCEDKTCSAYQVGEGGSAPVIFRVKEGSGAPAMQIEGGPFDAAGVVSFEIDGKDIGGGPAGPGREGEIETIVLESDDIALGLSRQMKHGERLTIEVPTTRGAETIEFGLDGYRAAMNRMEGASH